MGDAYDAAFRYNRAFGDTKVVAAIGYAKPGDTIKNVSNQYSGSASVLLGNGLNATVASAFREMSDDGRDGSTFWFTKRGCRANIFGFGKTSFSVDYAQQDDLNQNGDESTTWAIAAVQNMPSWGTEFYIAYRNYKLERDRTSFDGVNAILGGARVKF